MWGQHSLCLLASFIWDHKGQGPHWCTPSSKPQWDWGRRNGAATSATTSSVHLGNPSIRRGAEREGRTEISALHLQNDGRGRGSAAVVWLVWQDRETKGTAEANSLLQPYSFPSIFAVQYPMHRTRKKKWQNPNCPHLAKVRTEILSAVQWDTTIPFKCNGSAVSPMCCSAKIGQQLQPFVPAW